MKISDSVERIDGTMANSYYVNLNGEKIIIDAGTPGSGKKIIAYLESNRIKPDAVLVTHYHPDHTGGLMALHAKFGMDIYVPVGEAGIISGMERFPPRPFMPRFASMVMHAGHVREIKTTSEIPFKGIEPLKTPGHTRDSTSYILSGENIIFSGDAAVNLRGSPGYNRAFSASGETAEKSLREIESLHYLILPGHGNPMDFRNSV
ncbi:MAG: MBL fold metallo-hydrolase [Ferroplasma sp.]|uniref:MBL fold metallo-hydrolase n=1 Tax=Ferroplasma sp. TaxID=2591003 RepID=UPI0028167547|nr:MBL fold metallo-hydrolase [Ferroplasma sp.]WMT50816.1 MAG: MBL fold metallo-hydrolase [Ferroplasma sp.]